MHCLAVISKTEKYHHSTILEFKLV